MSRSVVILTVAFFAVSLHAQTFSVATTVDTPPSLEKPKLNWSGDLRYRLGKKRQRDDDPRHYQQVRARLALDAEVSETMRGNIRLASGTSALSTNQTLGDSADPGMPRRFFGIDQAYLNWKYLPEGKLWAGRTPNPFWTPGKSQILFDSDLSFEGLAVKYESMWSNFGFFLNTGGFIVSDNYTAPDDIVDTGIAAADLGVILKSDSWTWTTHVANFHYLNIQDKEIKRLSSGAAIDPYSAPFDRYNGNTVYVDATKFYYQNKYVLIEAGTEWKHSLGPIEYTAFFDWVNNTQVDRQGVAQEYGLMLKYKWLSGSYTIINKAADSLVGALTDDDAGGGGTDHRGWRVLLEAQFSKSISVAASIYRATRGVDTVPRSYEGTYLDALIKF